MLVGVQIRLLVTENVLRGIFFVLLQLKRLAFLREIFVTAPLVSQKYRKMTVSVFHDFNFSVR